MESKKRRLNCDNPNIVSLAQPITIKYNVMPTNVNLPLPSQISNAQTPQELTYNILTSGKTTYKKEEVLTIIGKIDNMISPKFPTNCDYIS